MQENTILLENGVKLNRSGKTALKSENLDRHLRMHGARLHSPGRFMHRCVRTLFHDCGGKSGVQSRKKPMRENGKEATVVAES